MIKVYNSDEKRIRHVNFVRQSRSKVDSTLSQNLKIVEHLADRKVFFLLLRKSWK